MKKIILLLIIFSLGCDRDPIFGLKRGWIIDNIFVLDCDEDILNQPCNITTTTTGTQFELVPFDIQDVNHPKTIYNDGDLYYFKISGNPNWNGTFYYYLYHNETLIHYYGAMSMVSNNATWPDLPLSAQGHPNTVELPSNCFTIRFVDADSDEIYVTEPFAICP